MMNPLSRTVCIGAVMFGLMTWMSASTQPLVLKVNELPSDLQRVPSTSAMFVTVRVADVWASETMKPIRELIAKQPGNPLEAIDQLGVKIENIERATLVLPSINEGGVSPLILVAMKQPFDASKLLKTLGARSPAAYMQDQIREEQKRYPGLYKMEPKFIRHNRRGSKNSPKSVEWLPRKNLKPTAMRLITTSRMERSSSPSMTRRLPSCMPQAR